MNYEQLLEDLSTLLLQIKEYLLALAPKLIGAVAVFLLGVLIAKIFQAIMRRIIKNADRIIRNKKLQTRIKQLQIEKSASLISKLVYWIIIIFFLTAATEILGLPIITTWLSGVIRYLPNILIAAIIIFLGLTGGKLLKDLLVKTSEKAGFLYSTVLGNSVQYAIILITILIAVNQVGINTGILTDLIDIIIAAILLGAALAFGLGAKTSISNILASYYLQNRYKEGQFVKIDDTEGRIIQITNVAVIIDSAQGQVSVPAKRFSENNSILINQKDSEK